MLKPYFFLFSDCYTTKSHDNRNISLCFYLSRTLAHDFVSLPPHTQTARHHPLERKGNKTMAEEALSINFSERTRRNETTSRYTPPNYHPPRSAPGTRRFRLPNPRILVFMIDRYVRSISM
jgi:hypothetical protein